jgi:hypothetical protein
MMSISPPRWPIQHDPLVCGIDGDTWCVECRRALDAETRRTMRSDSRRRRRQQLRPVARELAEVLRVYRRTIRRRLLELLADDITDIALAVYREMSE